MRRAHLILLFAVTASGLTWLLWGGADSPRHTALDPGSGAENAVGRAESSADLQAPGVRSDDPGEPRRQTLASAGEQRATERVATRRRASQPGELSLELEVRDDLGRPIPIVLLSAFRVPESQSESWNEEDVVGRRARFERSLGSETGRFTVRGFTPGDWLLVVDAEPAGWPASMGRQLVRVSLPDAGGTTQVVINRCASLQGWVQDHVGTPLAGVQLRIAPMLNSPEVVSGEDGSFEFPAVMPGRLELTGKYGSSEAIAQLQLAPGEQHTGALLEFPAHGSIAGLVLDPAGRPLEGMDVVLLQVGDDIGSRRTDDQGRFTYEFLDAGVYTLIAHNVDLSAKTLDPAIWEQTVTREVVVAPGPPTEVVLQRAAGGRPVRLFGKVTSNGAPVEREAVHAVQEGLAFLDGLRVAQTDEGGNYSMRLASPGPVLLNLENARSSFMLVVPPVNEFRYDIESPAGEIIVKVEGEASGRAEVLLSRADGMPDARFPELRIWASRGDKTFSGLGPGRYRLSVDGSGGVAAPPTFVELDSGESVQVTLQVCASGTVGGVVLDAAGATIEGAWIEALDAHGELRIDVESEPRRTDQDGRFTLEGLPVGELLISARTDQRAAFAPVRTVEGRQVDVELRLTEGVRLRVNTVDRGGHPTPAGLTVVDKLGRSVGVQAGTVDGEHALLGMIRFTTREFGPLPPGTYTVRADDGRGREVSELLELEAGPPHELTLTLR